MPEEQRGRKKETAERSDLLKRVPLSAHVHPGSNLPCLMIFQFYYNITCTEKYPNDRQTKKNIYILEFVFKCLIYIIVKLV